MKPAAPLVPSSGPFRSVRATPSPFALMTDWLQKHSWIAALTGVLGALVLAGCKGNVDCALTKSCGTEFNYECRCDSLDPQRDCSWYDKSTAQPVSIGITWNYDAATQQGRWLNADGSASLDQNITCTARAIAPEDAGTQTPDCTVSPCQVPEVCNEATKLCVRCTEPAQCPSDKAICTASGDCVQCQTDVDCAGRPGTTVCNTESGVCTAACTIDQDCAANPGLPICDQVQRQCVACRGPEQCAGTVGSDGSTATLACDSSVGQCVQCVLDTDCSNQSTSRCLVAQHRCVQCASNDHCSDREVGEQVCDLTAGSARLGQCVECTDHTQCTDVRASRCGDNRECAPCVNSEECEDGRSCNSGVCVTCDSNADCVAANIQGAPAPTCNLSSAVSSTFGQCVECVQSTDCTGAAEPVCGTIGLCEGCSANADCSRLAATPVCRPEVAGRAALCVECVADADCAGAESKCDVITNTCVACLVDADCTDPAAARCNVGTHTCQPCTADAQCDGKRTGGAANGALVEACALAGPNAGRCVQCTNAKDDACTGVCNAAQNTCQNATARSSSALCNTCLSDAHCDPGQVCVQPPGAATGGFVCLPSPQNGICASTARFVSLEPGATNTDQRPVTACDLAVSSCDALQDEGTTCAQDADCGLAGINDGSCINTPGRGSVCRVVCGNNTDCNGTLCDQAQGVCDLPGQ